MILMIKGVHSPTLGFTPFSSKNWTRERLLFFTTNLSAVDLNRISGTRNRVLLMSKPSFNIWVRKLVSLLTRALYNGL
jgi:hypothetical protein